MTASARAKSTHRPLIGVAISFGLGILLEEYARLPFALSCLGTVAAIGAGARWRNKTCVPLVLVCLAFIGVGYIHAQAHTMRPPDHIERMARYFYGTPVRLEGVVASDVEGRLWGKVHKTVFRLDVRRLHARGGWKKTRGEILVNLFRKEAIRPGDYLILEGKLHKPFEFSSARRFSYREYLDRKGIKLILSVKKHGLVDVLAANRGNLLTAGLAQWKGRLNAVLQEHFSGAALGVMQGFLLGDRYNIPEHINELFKLSGVAHILAISGFNVGIVAYATFLFLKIFPLGRRWHYILTMLILVLYAMLTGAQPPVVRATIMACVFLASFLLELETQPLNTLACAALILLFMNPLNLFDVGFQLSFVSVWAIIVIYPYFMDAFSRRRRGSDAPSPDENAAATAARYLLQSLALSSAAYLGVAVLIAYYFELVTPVAILANLAVIPLASVIVILGMGLLATGLVLPAAAFLFAHCIKVLLAVMVWIIFVCVQIPGAYFRVHALAVWVVVMYYLGILFLLWLARRRPPPASRHPADKAAVFS